MNYILHLFIFLVTIGSVRLLLAFIGYPQTNNTLSWGITIFIAVTISYLFNERKGG